MDGNYLGRLGLGTAEGDARSFRKSRLMEASSLRVGTLRNISRFVFSSNEETL